ncbi:MAG TPA: hypothetical protein VFI48_06225 [Hyphomicrobiaceae bacterium]|nr:hypothetical protein [Hyphomicrobiaceae bacterium]
MIDLESAHKWLNLAAMRSNADVKRYRMENAHEVSKAEIGEVSGEPASGSHDIDTALAHAASTPLSSA